MNTTKAFISTVILLMLVTALQLCRQYAQEWGISYIDPTDPNTILIINAVSCLLGIAIVSVWWIRFFVAKEQMSPIGSVSTNEQTLFPVETAGYEPTVQQVQAQPRQAEVPAPVTSNYEDVARVQITLSDGRTHLLIKMRVDCPQETRVAIGSSANCGIHIKDSTVSPHHADLLIHAGVIKLYNPGYNNGVRVGSRVVPGGNSVGNVRGQTILLGGVSILIA